VTGAPIPHDSALASASAELFFTPDWCAKLDPFTPDAVNRLVKRIGVRARFAFPIHAHMLRHACGYALANAGHDTRRIQDWLGHRSIQHTTRYTQLSAAPFKDFWR
jgi:type 1 fimbriae regulatory protein FimE